MAPSGPFNMSSSNGADPGKAFAKVYMVHIAVLDPGGEAISSVWDYDLEKHIMPTIMGIFEDKRMAESVLASLLTHERVPMGTVVEMPLNAFRALEDIL